MNDGFGLLIFFTVILGLLWGMIKGSSKQPIEPVKKPKRAKKRTVKEDLSLDDSEGDGLFFNEPLFPPDDFDNN